MKKKSESSGASGSPACPARYLYFTAAITGAAIMVVEILGAKMLAPYFGTSHFVWTAQIAVTLVALAAGYYAGGWFVDRSQSLSRLYAAIGFAAVWLCLSVPAVEHVSIASLKMRLAVGSLIAAAFLFFIPLCLLAMVGPFVIRLITTSVQQVGTRVGALTGLSTLGSFAGTVCVSYILIPRFPNSVSMFIAAGVLMAVSAGYFLVVAPRTRGGVALLSVLVVAMVSGAWAEQARNARALENVRLLFRGNSNFGQLEVVETLNGHRRYYMNDYLVQNTYDTQTKQSTSMFTFMLHGLAHAYTPEIRTVLCIGMGIGIVPGLFAKEKIAVDVVEINPAVVPIARNFFDFDMDALNVIVGDGRQFVNATSNRYDAVILDAFLGDSSPAHLMTVEAFGNMRRCLQPNGTIVMNLFGDFRPGKDFFIASIHKTLKAVFKSVVIHAEGNGNVFIVASDNPSLRILRQPELDSIQDFRSRNQVQSAFNNTPVPAPHSGIVLTDDFNPLDYFDSANREVIRRQLADSALHR